MRILLLTLMLIISFSAFGASSFLLPNDDSLVKAFSADVNVTGKWNMTAVADGDTIPVLLELKQDGESLTGTLSSQLGGGTIRSGKVTGNSLSGTGMVNIQGQDMEFTIAGTIDGDKMSGTITGPALPQVTFTAEKQK